MECWTLWALLSHPPKLHVAAIVFPMQKMIMKLLKRLWGSFMKPMFPSHIIASRYECEETIWRNSLDLRSLHTGKPAVTDSAGETAALIPGSMAFLQPSGELVLIVEVGMGIERAIFTWFQVLVELRIGLLLIVWFPILYLAFVSTMTMISSPDLGMQSNRN